MKQGTNGLEWTVVVASALLVAACVAVLGWEAATAQQGPPVITVTAGRPQRAAGGWAVPVVARNRGGETAANVHLEVQLGAGPEAPRGEVDVPFLPKGSARSAWVTFTESPGPGREPRVRVVGFGRP